MRAAFVPIVPGLFGLCLCLACVIDKTPSDVYGDEDQDGNGAVPDSDGSDPDGSTTGADDPTGSDDPTDDETSGGSGEPDPVGDDLPCEIQDILVAHCRTCHGANPAGGAPNTILSLDDLLQESVSSPGATVAEASLDRFTGAGPVMPPAPATGLSMAEIEAWSAWVSEGMPAGSCGEPIPPDPYDVDPQCTTDTFWTQGLFAESERMNPGRPCIGCHDDPEAFGGEAGELGPSYVFAGTVFATAHEPDDCFGLDGTTQDVEIVIRTEDGQELRLPVNDAGNFAAEPGDVPPGFAPPWFFRVVADGVESQPGPPLFDGDCNRCHSQDGDETAPGRLIPPY